MRNLFTIGLCFGLSFIQFSSFQVRCWGICYPIIWLGATRILDFPLSCWLVSRHWFMHRYRIRSLVPHLSFLFLEWRYIYFVPETLLFHAGELIPVSLKWILSMYFLYMSCNSISFFFFFFRTFRVKCISCAITIIYLQ